MQSVLLLTLEAYAGAAHLTHAEGVVGLDAHHLLDALALFLRVRLGTDGKHLQLGVAPWVDALFHHHLVQAGNVGRNSMDGRGAEILDELNLAQRVACGGRNGKHT